MVVLALEGELGGEAGDLQLHLLDAEERGGLDIGDLVVALRAHRLLLGLQGLQAQAQDVHLALGAEGLGRVGGEGGLLRGSRRRSGGGVLERGQERGGGFGGGR